MTRQEDLDLFGGRDNVAKMRDNALAELNRLQNITDPTATKVTDQQGTTVIHHNNRGTVRMNIETLKANIRFYESLLEEETEE